MKKITEMDDFMLCSQLSTGRGGRHTSEKDKRHKDTISKINPFLSSIEENIAPPGLFRSAPLHYEKYFSSLDPSLIDGTDPNFGRLDSNEQCSGSSFGP